LRGGEHRGHLSTAAVARILGWSEARVREFVRQGLCQPAKQGRRYAFSFQDLVVLYAARGLLAQNVPAVRVRRALSALVDQLAGDRPLSGLRVFANGGEVGVREDGTAWNPLTGQTLLDFQLDFRVDEVAKLVPTRASRGSGTSGTPTSAAQRALAHFDSALDLEDESPEAAEAAYRQALALDPTLVDAYVNLGRLAHGRGHSVLAASLYEKALRYSPEDPIIHFNLALAVEDSRGPLEAVPHYERALALDPDFADAHFNLAGLCEHLERGADALRHYRAYQKLTER